MDRARDTTAPSGASRGETDHATPVQESAVSDPPRCAACGNRKVCVNPWSSYGPAIYECADKRCPLSTIAARAEQKRRQDNYPKGNYPPIHTSLDPDPFTRALEKLTSEAQALRARVDILEREVCLLRGSK